jgi:LysM repeat protein
MCQKHPLTKGVYVARFAISAILALAVLGAALPQPVQAAVSCRAYYTVQTGDTTPHIAHTFNLKWKDIATANGMKVIDRLTTGQQLCIPVEEETTTTKKVTTPATDKKASIQVSIAGKRIFLSLSNFTQEHTYLVKVRDARVGIDGWYKYKEITVNQDTDLTWRFSVPEDLTHVLYLRVCLKDQYTNQLICRLAINP